MNNAQDTSSRLSFLEDLSKTIDFMSTSILPDMYRHTARKSTVTKSMKSTNGTSCSSNTSSSSSLSYLTNHHDGKFFQISSPTKISPISDPIKMEKDSTTERFLILPDNETEEMIIDEDIEKFVQETINQILEQVSSILPTTDKRMNTNDQIRLKTSQVEIDDIHQVLHSMLNTFHENDHQTISTESNKIVPMEQDESSILSSTHSHIDDQDHIEEISPPSNSTCACQCHLPSSHLNDEYHQFEQALRKTRLECEQEKFMQNNSLVQTLKRQHEELLSFVQQNKKFSRSNPITRVDREQQTSKLICQDFQIQTDIVTSNTNGIIPTIKSSIPSNPPAVLTTPTSTTNTNGLQTATRIHNNSSNIVRPRLSINSKTNGTTSYPPIQVSPNHNKKPTVTVPPPIPPIPPVPPARATHDIVDLTEEDEDDDTSRVPIQRAAPPAPPPSIPTRVAPATTAVAQTTQPSTTTTATVTASATVAARARPSTTTRLNDPLSSSSTLAQQTFPLRPLPEHVPCNQSIARPQLSITQENGTVRLTWNLPLTTMESIQNYEIYAYKQNAATATSDWKKIGTVKSMRLPMAVTLKEFQSNSHYAFAVRAVSSTNQIGPFCEPKTIFTGNTPVQPLHTSQLLNVAT